MNTSKISSNYIASKSLKKTGVIPSLKSNSVTGCIGTCSEDVTIRKTSFNFRSVFDSRCVRNISIHQSNNSHFREDKAWLSNRSSDTGDHLTSDILLRSFEARQEKVNITPLINCISNSRSHASTSGQEWSLSTYKKVPSSIRSISMEKDEIHGTANNSISSKKIVEYSTNNDMPQPYDRKWKNPVLGSNKDLCLPSVAKEKKNLKRKLFDSICCTVSFTKEMLKNLIVLGQVDDKFIACVFQSSHMLVLIDQHAAHERIRLEKLLNQIDYYSRSKSNTTAIKMQHTRIVPPVCLTFHDNEVDLISHYSKELSDAGLKLSFTKWNSLERSNRKVYALTVPSMFVSVCSLQTEVNGSAVNMNLIKEFINEQVQFMRKTGGRCNMSSMTIFKVLASHACHGAIKFGDKLSMEKCMKIMDDLAKCDLPFQCAHGRPSIAPLFKLDILSHSINIPVGKPNLSKLRLHK